MFSDKWNTRFLSLAKQVSGWSHDPSTKVGAVIVRPDKTIVSLGYNGFPRGITDSADRYANRELKYALVVHAEANCILNAHSCNLYGCAIYVYPLFTCAECAKLIAQSGIKLVVSPAPSLERWKTAYETAQLIYSEAGIVTVYWNNVE